MSNFIMCYNVNETHICLIVVGIAFLQQKFELEFQKNTNLKILYTIIDQECLGFPKSTILYFINNDLMITYQVLDNKRRVRPCLHGA